MTLTSNGAISVGAYEAGVNWIVTEALRIAHYDSATWTAVLGNTTDQLTTRFRLASAAGASAGNVNTILSALTYCADPKSGALHADSSLFWKVWVSVGIEQLFPGIRNDGALKDMTDPGPFSRQFIKEQSWAELRAFRDSHDSTQVYPGCHVPVGITLTQLDTESFAISSKASLSAPVQRLATVFDVRAATKADSSTYGPGRLGFFPVPDSVAFRRSLGTIALIPELYAHTPELPNDPATKAGSSSLPQEQAKAKSKPKDPGALSAPDSAVLWLVEAGSAVPPAFAPRWLCYVPAGRWPTNAQPRPASLPNFGYHCHRFTDGGVFDNNPLALGFDLARFVPESTLPKSRSAGSDKIWIAVSNPYQRRPEPAAGRAAIEDSTLGLGYLVSFITGFVPAARRSELQSFGRLLARIEEDSARSRSSPEIIMSSRGPEIVGTQFGSFGAFLGHPFREFDFYAGVYDGLHMLAESFICADAVRKQLWHSEWQTRDDSSRSEADCARNALARLLASANPLNLDPFTLHMVQQFAAKEGIVALSPHDAHKTTAPDSLRLIVLEAILNSPAPPKGSPKCEEPGYIGHMMCASQFASLLHHLRTNKTVANAIHVADTSHVECLNDTTDSRGHCFVDASFIRLVRAPERFMEDLVEDLLYRAWMIERHEEHLAAANVKAYPSYPKTDAPVYHQPHTTVASVARFVNRRLSASMGRGFQWDPSSVPDRHVGDAWWVFHVLPYYISVGTGVAADRTESGARRLSGLHQTPFTLGWQPTLSVGNRHPDVAFTLPLEVSHILTAGDVVDSLRSPRTRLGLAAGLGAEFRRSDPYPIGVAVLLANHLLKPQGASWDRRGSYPYVNGGTALVPEISTNALKGSVRAAFRWTLPLTANHVRRSEYAIQFSVLDVNGLLYWAFR